LEDKQILDAYKFTASGGGALHLFHDPGVYPGAPPVFKKSREAAHLLDQDLQRLREIAKALGVRVIKVSYEGTPKQHIDLCGRPLKRAIEICEK